MEIDDETRPVGRSDHTGPIVNESVVTNHTDIIDAVVVNLQVINVTEDIQINDAPTVQVSQNGNSDDKAAGDSNIRPETPNGADEADDCKQDKDSDDVIVRICDENSTLKSIIEAKTNEEDHLKNEISSLKNIIKSKESDEALLNARIQQLQNDYKIKLEHFQESQKDKTSIIMKYAEAEKRCIDLNRTIDTLQTKLQSAQKENKLCTDKCDKLQLEKQKLNENLSGLRQNFDKIKEQNILTDAKLNIVQAKLKLEINSHLETKNLYEKLVSEYEKKSVNDNDDLVNKQMNEKYNDLIEEISTLKDKLNFYENDYKNHESNIAKYTDTLQSQKQLNKDLLTEILQLRELQAVLTKEQTEKANLLLKVEQLTNDINESNNEMVLSKQKQTELLIFTEKMTEKNTILQSSNTILTEKLQNVEMALVDLKNKLHKSEEAIKLMAHTLNQKIDEQSEQNKNLNEKLTDSIQQVHDLTTKLNDEKDEKGTLKKKHVANVKDLSRQLQKLQAQLDKTVSTCKTKQLNIVRSSSSNSLVDIKEDTKSINGSISSTDSNQQQHQSQPQHQPNHDDNYVYVVDIEKQKIIDKIVKLQKTLAKKNEKIDFLQDHVNQLTLDLQRKTRIIQGHAMQEDVGVFTSSYSQKTEMPRKPGIMASLYGTSMSSQTANKSTTLSALNGTHMTMDLCLEINAKLQTLLEDTLIKNITLKESLDCLGHEIAQLSQENRQIKMNII